MNFETLFYFFFSSIALSSAIFVIYSTNTIYSAFFLILVFVSATGLLLISEVEFISIMLIIIYVGAITVLFLFVIMMLDINLLNDTKKNQNFGYLPIIFLISFTFFIETFLMCSKTLASYHHFIQNCFVIDTRLFGFDKKLSSVMNVQTFNTKDVFFEQFISKIDTITNVETIGQILYTYYAFFFLIAGIILIIALIGAVTLTKKEKKKQNYLTKNLYKQLSRNYLNAIFNAK